MPRCCQNDWVSIYGLLNNALKIKFDCTFWAFSLAVESTGRHFESEQTLLLLEHRRDPTKTCYLCFVSSRWMRNDSSFCKTDVLHMLWKQFFYSATCTQPKWQRDPFGEPGAWQNGEERDNQFVSLCGGILLLFSYLVVICNDFNLRLALQKLTQEWVERYITKSVKGKRRQVSPWGRKWLRRYAALAELSRSRSQTFLGFPLLPLSPFFASIL